LIVAAKPFELGDARRDHITNRRSLASTGRRDEPVATEFAAVDVDQLGDTVCIEQQTVADTEREPRGWKRSVREQPDRHALRRQERALDVNRQIQIAFEGALFGRSQTAEARAEQRVGGDAPGLDRALTYVAYTESPPFDAAEGVVYLLEQPRERPRIGSVGDDRLEPPSAFEQLMTSVEVGIFGDHGFHVDAPALDSTRGAYRRAIRVLRSKSTRLTRASVTV